MTYSYLLARKDPPSERSEQLARIVGDPLKERGKTKQLVCRGEQREFLSWLHKQGEPKTFYRGEVTSVPADIPKKGNELRVSQSTD